MLLALSSEAWAAIVGALAGGLIALLGHSIFVVVESRNARRTAGAMIFAELVGNYANAAAAVEYGQWSSPKPEPYRAAWDAYGAKLLLLRIRRRPHEVGHVAIAYNRLDDIAWLGTDARRSARSGKNLLADVLAGMYVAGKIAGYSDGELRDRDIPVDDIRAQITEEQNRIDGD